jgi:hypothetical protein
MKFVPFESLDSTFVEDSITRTACCILFVNVKPKDVFIPYENLLNIHV